MVIHGIDVSVNVLIKGFDVSVNVFDGVVKVIYC